MRELIEAKVSSLENRLSAIDESTKKLENRIENLESKQQLKPEEEVKQLTEALTPPKPQPLRQEVTEDVKQLDQFFILYIRDINQKVDSIN
jgi:polyribonucleotide nucleotidyltransferase